MRGAEIDRNEPASVTGCPLLDADVSRGFVVRAAKREARRGGMGAVRVRESYLRSDRLLFRVSDSLLGGSSDPPDNQSRCYICPTAGFLHCYLELFDHPQFTACFEAPGSGNTGGCRLLLLHSELAKLTGATGAMSIRQERRLVERARALRGTLVFFDKFCPDLHLHQGGVATPGSRSSVAPVIRNLSPILAACGWCRAQLGNSSMVVLTEDGGGKSVPIPIPRDPVKATSCDRVDGVRVLDLDGFLLDFIGDGAREELGKRGDLLRRAYLSLVQSSAGLQPFLLAFRGGRRGKNALFREGEARDIARSDNVVRPFFDAVQQAPVAGGGGGSGGATGEGVGGQSPLAMPHPSKARLEAMVAKGEAFRGKLDVFEHNPGEGYVMVGRGGGSGDLLDGLSDPGGRTQIPTWDDQLFSRRHDGSSAQAVFERRSFPPPLLSRRVRPWQVLVVGKAGMNRSMHGDTVVVTILPRRRWRTPTDRKRLTHVSDEDSGDGVDGADPGLGDDGGEGGQGADRAPPGTMPTGVVVGVLEEGRRPYVVTIPPEEVAGTGPVGGGAMTTVTAVPMDPRVPKIRIKTRQLAQISGQRLVAMVDGWDVGHVFPFGHYVTSLGPVGEVASEAAALIVECQAAFDPFSFKALASLPMVPNPPRESQERRDTLLPPPTLAEQEKPEDGFGRAPRWQDSGWRVQDKDITGRRDLRGERTMSIDPPGCQDIDDAMHVTRKPNGKLQIGVHIADVTHFVDAEGPLDKEARVRATTVYLVHRRIDMLPALLSSDLCSLHAGRDRLSVSVVWEAEEVGEDIRLSKGAEDSSTVCWFGRTVIHSKASMTYDQAESLVEQGKIVQPRGYQEPPLGQAGRNVDDALQPGLAEDLRLLTRFARTMRKERAKNGAIDLSQAGAELKFKVDPATGAPLAVSGKEESEIHHTVAELMILANSAVAKKIREAFPSAALLRVHAPPDPSRLTAFEGVAVKVGVQSAAPGGEVKRSTKGLYESLATVEGGGLKGERGKADLLKSLAVRAMAEAEYVSTGALSRHEADGTRTDPMAVDGIDGRRRGKWEEAEELVNLYLQGGRFGHFGLGLSHYTHFTSPIRRYADIVVHRLLLVSIGVTQNAVAMAKSTRTEISQGRRHREHEYENEHSTGAEDTTALPPSLAPSVIEIEEAAVGVGVMEEAERRSRRAGAGDASFVTNPDGTRTYNKVSMAAVPSSAPRNRGVRSAAGRPRPPPGFESLKGPDSAVLDVTGGGHPGDDGDDLLDALLGLEVADPLSSARRGVISGIGARGATVGAWPPEDVAEGDDRSGLSGQTFKNTLLSSLSESPMADADAVDRVRSRPEADGDGDSTLDALLGLGLGLGPEGEGEREIPPDGDHRQNQSRLLGHVSGGENRRTDNVARRGGDGSMGRSANEGVVKAKHVDAAGELERDKSGERAIASPPFDGAELGRLCGHLNDRNRKAKQLAQRCQEMFLSLFFKDHAEIVQGLVLGLRSNGFIAYVPAFDTKGPVYLSDVDGQIQVDPTLLGLPATSGNPADKGFAALAGCRAIPSATISLVTAAQSSSPKALESSGEVSAATASTGSEKQEVLEVRPPPGSGGRVLRLGVLDHVRLRLSCDVLPTQARLPKVRFLLVGVGRQAPNAGKTDRQHGKYGTSHPGAGRLSSGGGRQFSRVETRDSESHKRRGTNQLPTGEKKREYGFMEPPRGSETDEAFAQPEQGERGDEGGLYWVLQGTLREAILTNPTLTARAHIDEQAIEKDVQVGNTDRRVAETAAVSMSTTTSTSSCSGRGRRKVSRPASSGRSEVGAGRALFGGFVPSRQAPAASLYDFGDSGKGSEGGVATLGSIYRSGAGKSPVVGTLDTLDDAKVRQYTQEATARLQRLGAEKRNSRVSRSKRQG